MKILIVEDEVALAKVLEEKFTKEGFDVKLAMDGEAALTVCAKFKPEMVLLDIILPKMRGLEVLEKLKEDEELKDIPVIILSNLDSDEDIKKALGLGALDYFVKTQHMIGEVVEKVRGYLVQPKVGKSRRR
jgi:DNA-binding response OmpR family regulator